jgi:hypothetical protein
VKRRKVRALFATEIKTAYQKGYLKAVKQGTALSRKATRDKALVLFWYEISKKLSKLNA